MDIYLIEFDYNDINITNKILEWRNEDEARNNFINTNIITIDILKNIFEKYRESEIIPNIIYQNNIPIGIIYFTLDNNKIYIGINIQKDYRSKGIGNISLELFLKKINHNINITYLYAKIKKTNHKSINLFSKSFILNNSDDIYNEYIYQPNLKYVLCSIESYYTENLFKKIIKKYNINEWKLITDNTQFKDNIIKLNPNKCFFLHWPYIVPKKIYENIECINFHTGNLPNGRGGSPLQNQIMDNIKISNINSLKITNDGIDSGPSYNKTQISLQGNIFDIFNLISDSVYYLIVDIIDNSLKPLLIYNYDSMTIYKRINDNSLKFNSNIEYIYDQIRMRDYTYYEKTYINIENIRISFSRAYFDGEKILCDAIITNNK